MAMLLDVIIISSVVWSGYFLIKGKVVSNENKLQKHKCQS